MNLAMALRLWVQACAAKSFVHFPISSRLTIVLILKIYTGYSYLNGIESAPAPLSPKIELGMPQSCSKKRLSCWCIRSHRVQNRHHGWFGVESGVSGERRYPCGYQAAGLAQLGTMHLAYWPLPHAHYTWKALRSDLERKREVFN